jgi:excisionase family DNA binding protein
MPQELLTIRTIARKLDVSEKSVRRWITSGKLKNSGYDIHGRYLVDQADLDAFIVERTKRGTHGEK